MNKASKKKSHTEPASPEKKTDASHHGGHDHVDDRPKRDDDDLSALLQTSDPESSSRGKGGTAKK